MSLDHHDHEHGGLDSIISSQVARLVHKHITHPEVNVSLKHEIFSELSECIKTLAVNYRRVSPDKFLTKPCLLKDGSCVVLLDVDLPNTSNSFKLVVNEDLGNRYLFSVFQENAQQMSSSTFFKLSREQEDELQRQLWTLKETATYFKTPMVLTMMVVSQQIDNYEYADAPEVVSDDQGLQPHQLVVVEESVPGHKVVTDDQLKDSVALKAYVHSQLQQKTNENITDKVDAPIQAKKGPTPAKTLYDIEVLQRGNTTTVMQRPA
jgi:hypothetical protein